MDLHAWITQQVDRAEEQALAELEGRRAAFKPNRGGPPIVGTITASTHQDETLSFTIAQYEVESRDQAPAPMQSATASLRRCEADRRILARHNVVPDEADHHLYATACHGCGTHGDCDDPEVENLNDCPELLDLAHAHGMTSEILSGLDRPQPPEPKRRTGPRLGLTDILATLTITTSDVPAALRGPRWKP